jgi:hypothetical protein
MREKARALGEMPSHESIRTVAKKQSWSTVSARLLPILVLSCRLGLGEAG